MQNKFSVDSKKQKEKRLVHFSAIYLLSFQFYEFNFEIHLCDLPFFCPNLVSSFVQKLEVISVVLCNSVIYIDFVFFFVLRFILCFSANLCL